MKIFEELGILKLIAVGLMADYKINMLVSNTFIHHNLNIPSSLKI